MGRHGLTTQQWKCVMQAGDGKSHEDIGNELGIATVTVSSHINAALKELGVNSTIRAVNRLNKLDRRERLDAVARDLSRSETVEDMLRVMVKDAHDDTVLIAAQKRIEEIREQERLDRESAPVVERIVEKVVEKIEYVYVDAPKRTEAQRELDRSVVQRTIDAYK